MTDLIATRTGLELSELSLGCAQLGNLYREVSDEEAGATVGAAWDLGVRYFDTAPHYGIGLSERRLGPLLAAHPRDAYVLSTKVGRLLEPVAHVEGLDDQGFVVPATHRRVWDFSRDGIRRSIEESLERLGLERVDIAYLHDPDDHMREVFETGYPALEELRSEGVLRAIGAGMNFCAPLADLVRNTDLDLLMLAGRYTLLEQDALDELLPLCVERGVGIVAAGVFNSGLLARAQVAQDAKYNYEDAPPELVERARAIAAVCEQHGTTLPAAALQFPLGHPAVVSVCIGARSAEQVARNVALHGESIAPDLWRQLKAEGLLRDDAPCPGVSA
ncbi:MAG: aldo/keto reductase [Solirubrobacteraceae bacterium]|jgi:D-threo-aldose 1-dehydrogenase